VGRKIETEDTHVPPPVQGDRSYATGRSIPTWPTAAGCGRQSMSRDTRLAQGPEDPLHRGSMGSGVGADSGAPGRC
jgi:hypothetical protein